MSVSHESSRLGVAFDDISETELVPAKLLTGGSISAQIVHGRDSSMMIATRQPGYHSMPHAHDCEQLNYVLQGELLVFIGEECLLAKKGDVFRVPRNAIHWSWVQGSEPSILLESHSPPLIGDPGVLDTATALTANKESLSGVAGIASDWPKNFDRDAAEAYIFARFPHLKR